jgi:hypothetical protein
VLAGQRRHGIVAGAGLHRLRLFLLLVTAGFIGAVDPVLDGALAGGSFLGFAGKAVLLEGTCPAHRSILGHNAGF